MHELYEPAVAYFRELQDRICQGLREWENRDFHEDIWDYGQGGTGSSLGSSGGGRTRVLTEGTFLEKGGVNFSDVRGHFPEDFAKTMPGQGTAFQATGVSLVLHPWNPKVPTVHANFRFICREGAAWFGGGADLTPYYPYRQDCIHFHRVWQDVCQRHSQVADYNHYKKWCDEYFFLKHRQEARGIGGIFFDNVNQSLPETFAFVQDAGNQFLTAYGPIVQRRVQETYTPAERDFQLYRRGRYVEFNLIYDRGTLFGLKTAGRVESILMSLPLNVKWLYDYQAPAGSRAAELLDYLQPRDWANET